MTGNRFRFLSLGLLGLATSVAMLAQAADVGVAGGAIRQMQRLDGDRGVVLTDSALLSTRDGGASWADVTPERGLAGVSEAFFLDPYRGWLAGTTPGEPSRLVVLDTADAGTSWRERAIDASDAPDGYTYAEAQVHFPDAAHGWLLGRLATGSAVSAGELLRTADGGESWERLPAPPTAGEIVFASPDRGFMTGAPVSDRLYRTLDGGRSWQELSLPFRALGEAYYGLPRFTTPQDGTVSVTLPGRPPRLLTFVTRDGGLTWQPSRSLALPAGDYSEPVPATLTPSGDPAAFGAGSSIVRERPAVGRVLTSRVRPTREASPGRALAPPAVPSIRALATDEDGSGWALVAEGECDQGVCRQTTRLVAIDPAGRTADLLVRSSAAGPSLDSALTSAATISFGKGFDKCDAPTVAQMQTWRASSPYRDANIYYGGSARACKTQANLSASWVTSVFQQGWRLIPTWVGPQAPCSVFATKFSSTTSTARSQGLAEADSAVSAAAALGLGAGTPIYYDMEAYSPTTACSAAVRAFVNAWSERLKARGYVSGVYGTASNTQADWRPGLFTYTPDAVWLASWYCTGSTCSYNPTTVFGIRPVSDSYWVNNQRIHQYWGGHSETWGGVTFSIDTNFANGPVAAPDGVARPDLVVDSVSMSPASPAPGQAVTFSAVVRNSGTAATPSGVAIGVSYRVDGTQVASGSVNVSLAAGATVTVTGIGSWTATAGTHTLAAVVDGTNLITEANESNNQLSRSITIGGVAQFICDDGDACFALYGPSAYWHRTTTCGTSALGYGGDMYWTYVNGSVVSNYVRWTPALGGSGTYAVSVFVPRCDATSQVAKYKVVHNGVTEYKTVNQNVYYDAWVPLGTFAFAGTGGEYVELTDATGESYTTKRLLGFDAVKWVRQ